MKTNLIVLSLLSCLTFSKAQSSTSLQEPGEKPKLRSIENNAFAPGEVLEFRIHYGIIDAGTARIEVKKEQRQIGGRDVLHVVGTGRSTGAFDWFFKVRDTYESYIDAQGIFPWIFVRRWL